MKDATRAEMMRLRNTGMAMRSIAKALQSGGFESVSAATVGRELKKLEQKGTKVFKDGRGRPRKDAQQSNATRPPPKLRPIDKSIAEEADESFQRLLGRRDDATYLANEAKAALNIGDFEKMAKLEKVFCSEVIAMRPPTPPDPDVDPANLKARDETRERLNALVLRHETKLCDACLKKHQGA